MSPSAKERVRVREARSEDDAAIGELLVAAYISQYAKKLPEVVYTEERKRDLRAVAEKRKVASVWAAELDGKVVGTVALFPPGAPGTEAWLPDAADLRHLGTAPELHGQGLAQPLLDAALAQAKAWGVKAVCLHVRKGVEGVARLYMKRGFVRAPEGDLTYPTVSLEAYVLPIQG
ncbi:GNAT family N-acetyltransferase [Aggregicoccus sp. 17bor-14]|uniref:GNAT family N-acetyltransferase n=1 Tax=Myxococcaceae TaxID=31 RepID=UPI00129C91FF|nr:MULTISPECIES: GNAT family N-acetyltransferase [Myxococcaceae]MBF5043497.1 GNAT family N-acetyltransferase [Simulacricoccus sp. 17bor-14]MRI89255.1 GNAT family N-acetyltransferase [Aggregicoccus sp. 17bor-14]